MGKVIPFAGITRLDLPPDQILEGAKGEMEGVLVIGFKKDSNGMYMASSYADGGTNLWLLEKCKRALLNYDED